MKVILSSIYPYIFAFLLFIVPFDSFVRAWPNILLIVLSIIFPFIVNKKDLQKLRNKNTLLYFLFLGVMLLLLTIQGDFSSNLFVVEKIGISLAFLILFLPVNDYKKINNAIVFSSLAAIVYSVFKIMMLIKTTGSFDFANNSNPTETLLIDRLYLGLLSVLSIIISVRSMGATFNRYNKYHLANIIINVAFVLLIVARSAIIILVVLAILKFFYSKKSKKLLVITSIFIVATLAAAAIFNKNIKQRFLYENQYNTDEGFVEKVLKVEPRVIIWGCAKDIADAEGVTIVGIGFREVKNRLLDCYSTNAHMNEGRIEWFLKRKYNIHNQYLDIYFGSGLIGLLLFLLFLGYSFYQNRKNFYNVAMLTTFVLFGLIEVYFQRQIGAYYFGVLLIFILLQKNSAISSNIKSLENE